MPGQSHALMLKKGYANLLLNIKAKLALVRWLPVDQNDQKGIGYYLYEAGTMKYDSVFKEIHFIVEPLKLSKKNTQTKTKIMDIKYNLYISTSEDELKEASLCEKYFTDSVISIQKIHETMYRNSFKFAVRVTIYLFRKIKLW